MVEAVSAQAESLELSSARLLAWAARGYAMRSWYVRRGFAAFLVLT